MTTLCVLSTSIGIGYGLHIANVKNITKIADYETACNLQLVLVFPNRIVLSNYLSCFNNIKEITICPLSCTRTDLKLPLAQPDYKSVRIKRKEFYRKGVSTPGTSYKNCLLKKYIWKKYWKLYNKLPGLDRSFDSEVGIEYINFQLIRKMIS